MELRDYLHILQRRLWLVVLTLIITIIVTTVALREIPPTYTARATLRLITGTDGSIGWEGVLYTDRLMKTYARTATSNQTLALLQQQIPSDPAPHINAEQIADTELIAVEVQHENPLMAEALANGLATILVDESNKHDANSRAYPLVIADQATVPTAPSSPRTTLILTLAAVVGLVAGLGLVFVAEGFDTRLSTGAQIQRATGLTVLVGIPHIRRWRTWKPRRDSLILAEETFRQLRTDLFWPNRTPPIRSLLVTSAEPREGKTFVAVNLALSIAQAGKTVLLIDCDMRSPTSHTLFEQLNTVGLSTLLQCDNRLAAAVRPSGVPRLYLLSSGPPPQNPTELLNSNEAREVFSKLQLLDAVLIFDSPAAAVVADAYTVVPFVDGVLLVVQRQRAHANHVEAACERLRRAGAHLLGVVVNAAEPHEKIDYYPTRSRRPTPALADPVGHCAKPEEVR